MKRRIRDTRSHLARPPVAAAIVLASGSWLGAVHLARDLLQVAGTIAARSTDVRTSALFTSIVVADRQRPIAVFGRDAVRPESTVQRGKRFEVIIVPPQFAVTADLTEEDRRLCAWLNRQYRQGALILSLGGTVLLAKAGLLDGCRATGFSSDRQLFARHFPRIRYQPSLRLVAEEGIVTICGIAPIVDGCAHLIEHFYGPTVARRFLRHTSTDALPAANHLALWASSLKRHEDQPVLSAQEIIEHSLPAVPAISDIARRVGLGERTLSRRFAGATGLSVRAYVAQVRLELAESLLRSTSLPLAHIADECGFGGASALSRAFAASRSISPSRYRARSRGA